MKERRKYPKSQKDVIARSDSDEAIPRFVHIIIRLLRFARNDRCLFGQLLLALLLCGFSCNKSMMSEAKTITVQEVHSILEQKDDVVLLDVRTPQEFNGELGHLPDALLIPVQELEARYQELEPYKNKEMVVYCRSGNRSGRAVDFLSQKGFKVKNMTGGMLEWRKQFGEAD